MTTRELLVLGHDVRQVQPVYAKPTKMTFEMRMRLLKPCNVLRRAAYPQRRRNSSFAPWSARSDRRQAHRPKEDCEMSVAVITGTSNLNPLEGDVEKVAVVELDPRKFRRPCSPAPMR
jgi:hypothetical protein